MPINLLKKTTEPSVSMIPRFDEKHIELMRHMGTQMKIIRSRRGLTQVQLAKKAGCSAHAIHQIETYNPIHPFSLTLYYSVAQALDCDVEVRVIETYASLSKEKEGLCHMGGCFEKTTKSNRKYCAIHLVDAHRKDNEYRKRKNMERKNIDFSEKKN